MEDCEIRLFQYETSYVNKAITEFELLMTVAEHCPLTEHSTIDREPVYVWRRTADVATIFKSGGRKLTILDTFL